MATTNNQVQNEIEELQKRLEWLDKERLKAIRRTTTIEQRQTSLERELETRDQRIKELETKLAAATLQIARASQIDSELQLFKDEMVKMIEQYDSRRRDGQEEIEKLRRVEHEMNLREFAAIKKEIIPISRVENEIELRQAEAERLAGLIGSQQSTLSGIISEVANWQQQLSFVSDSERTNAKSIGDLHTGTVERSKKIETLDTRLEVVSHSQIKAQAAIQEIADSLADLQQDAKTRADQLQIGEHQRNKRLVDWQADIDSFQDQMDSFTSEWVKFDTQYKESKMAVQTLVDWQSRIESKQQEAAELARIESNQLLSQWDSFQVENDKRWKNYEVDREQRWARSDRWEKQISGQLQELKESIDDIHQEKDALWRVQNAQADVMKMLPRIWKEEMEKARDHNPNSRRQPALVPVRED